MQLSDLDLAIIRQLEADGRKAFREIARELDASEATVRARVHRLRESGVLRIVAFADPAQMGRSQLGLLLIRAQAEHRSTVLAALADRAEVSYVSTVLGRSDVFAQVLVRDIESLWAFINDYVETLPGILETETIVEVGVHKLQFASPT